ncbi:hypothetical protein [uncultured Cohaesibacter sp.]|uniref:hypothetical protein n=1 Tax=uncultured Cohaesibacter sp. TaxID=1002546 RepID=UPI0029C742D4|nr:hypothetical protein [uncultured Cohaesibacter sp.]
MKSLAVSAVVGAFLLTVSLPAFAGFDEDVTKAYAPYRVALFKSNQNDKEATEKAVGKFLTIWDGAVIAGYPNAPARYAGEPDWSGTLARIKVIGEKAMEATRQGQLVEAHEILEAVRDELDSLRDRNGVRVFSNFVNAYHSAMEHVLTTKVSADSWNRQTAGELYAGYGVLSYLAEDLAAHAPSDLKADEAFNGLLGDLMSSVEGLKAALDSDDPAAIAKAVKALKPAYAKLFVKFG